MAKKAAKANVVEPWKKQGDRKPRKKSRNLWQTLKAKKSFTFTARYKLGEKRTKEEVITVISRFEDATEEYRILYQREDDRLFIATVEYSDVFNWSETDDTKEIFDRALFSKALMDNGDETAGVISANNVVIINADHTDAAESVHLFNLRRYALVSFNAVALLWDLMGATDSATEKKVIELLTNATVVHTTPDDEVDTNKRISAKRVKQLFADGYSVQYAGKYINKDNTNYENDEKLKPILESIRKYQRRFHKAGMTLIKYKDDVAIFGFDDRQYFGCLLPPECNPKTVTKALNCLRPKEIMGRYERQGEWFIQPIDKPYIWGQTGTILYSQSVKVMDENNVEVRVERISGCLPRETDVSNCHEFVAKQGVANEDGSFTFENLELTHDQHPKIKMEGWCKVIKNLAVRSVSAEGVD